MGVYIIDIETTGLDRHKDKINLVGVYEADSNKVYQTTNRAEFRELYKTLGLGSSLCVFHNAKFDMQFLEYHYQTYFNNVLDTIVMFYLYNPYRKSYALKPLIEELFNISYDVSTDIKTGTSKEMLEYNAMDLQVTYLLYKYCTDRLSEKEVRLAKHLTKIDRVYAEITERGGLLEKVRCSLELSKTKVKMAELERFIRKYVGDININSTQQLAKVLYSKLGYVPKRKTEKGLWSVDTNTLKEYGSDLTNALVEYRGLSKLKSAFLEPYNGKDIIHPQFRITGTTSGRTSSAKPNLQQLPRGSTVRNLLRVPSQDYVFVEIDYSQMELRCAGQIGKIKNIIKAYQEDKDIHTLTAQLVSGREEITEQDRFQAKAVNFGRPI